MNRRTARAARRAAALRAVLLLLAIAAPACGRGDDGGAPAGAAGETAAPSAAPGPTAAPAPLRAQRAILVTIDTLRADRVGAYGAGPGSTPALDALAARGARFETAISPAPLTLPAHATLLTGLDPPEHGVHHNGRFRLADGVPVLAEHLRARGFATAAFVASYVLDARFGLARGFDLYDDELALEAPGDGATAVAERPADLVVDAALAWLAQAPERFFLWVHLYDPHAEHRPPEPFATRFAHDLYAGEIAFADEQVGRLLAALDTRFPDGASLVVATADHGESLGEHGETTHAYTLYDATQRVPLLVAGPGIPAGVAVPEVVRLADVAPSLVEGLAQDPLPAASGASLFAALAGRGAAPQVAYLETLATRLDWGWSPLFGVRTEHYKYVRAPRPELYDLREDPGERRDRAAELPAVAAELDRLLEARVAGRGAPEPNRELAADERARLEALGYVGEPRPAPARRPGSDPLGAVGGDDPKDFLQLVDEFHRVNTLVGLGRFEEALAAADRLGQGDEEPQLALRLLTLRAALGAGRTERVKELAKALHQEAATEPETHAVLGLLAEEGGDAAGARRAYERAIALGAPSAAPLLGLGRLAEAEGRVDESRSYYERARSEAIPDPEPLWRLAALDLEGGRIEQGAALLARIPAGFLRAESAALRLGRAELAAGRPDFARLRVEAALVEAPTSARLRALQADAAQAEGDLRGAREAREAWLRLEPDAPAAQNAVAGSLASLGVELHRAHSLAERAVERTGGAAETLDTLVAVRVAQGAFREALDLADDALRRAEGETRARLHYRRAEALAGLGRPAEAAAALARAREEAGGAPALRAEDQRVAARLASPRPAPASR